jgi:hypothetical protein
MGEWENGGSPPLSPSPPLPFPPSPLLPFSPSPYPSYMSAGLSKPGYASRIPAEGYQVNILSEIKRISTRRKYESRSIEYFLELFESAWFFIRSENFRIRKIDAMIRIPEISLVLIISKRHRNSAAVTDDTTHVKVNLLI